MVFCHDKASGLRAIVALHSTALGPALGGCRMWPYANEAEALTDVLRLSQAMSYKHAVAKTPHGGGKSVILADPARDKSEALLRAFGRFIERLGGRYVVAEDVGTTADDMAVIRRETSAVAGISTAAGGSGDPSPVTAYGVFCGIKAAVRFRLGRDNLTGLKVAVQGVGHVGYALAKYLRDAGANLFVSDLDAAAVAAAASALGASPVGADEIYDLPADIFAPCALGATVNRRTIPRLKAAIVAGAANNQLAEPADGAALAARGILYAPDYVINAGGIINIACERGGYDRDRAMKWTEEIYRTSLAIFERAREDDLPTNVVADRIAAERLAAR